MRWPSAPMVESAGLGLGDPAMQRRTVLGQLAAVPAILSFPVSAQAVTKIAFGYSAVTDFATVFIGADFPKAYTELGVVGRVGANIKTPADFIGKKVGVPGLGRAAASHLPPMAQAQWCGLPPGGVHRGAVPAACRPDPWWLAGSCITRSRFPGMAISSPASRTRWAAARSPALARTRPAR